MEFPGANNSGYTGSLSSSSSSTSKSSEMVVSDSSSRSSTTRSLGRRIVVQEGKRSEGDNGLLVPQTAVCSAQELALLLPAAIISDLPQCKPLNQKSGLVVLIESKLFFKQAFKPNLHSREIATLSCVSKGLFNGMFSDVYPAERLADVMRGWPWRKLVERDYPWFFQIYNTHIRHNSLWLPLSDLLSSEVHWDCTLVTPNMAQRVERIEDLARSLKGLQRFQEPPQQLLKSGVSCVARLFDGKIIASGYADGRITLLYSSHVPPAVLEGTSRVLAIASSPMGDNFTSLHANGQIRQWFHDVGQLDRHLARNGIVEPPVPLDRPVPQRVGERRVDVVGRPRISRCKRIMNKVNGFHVGVIFGIAMMIFSSLFNGGRR